MARSDTTSTSNHSSSSSSSRQPRPHQSRSSSHTPTERSQSPQPSSSSQSDNDDSGTSVGCHNARKRPAEEFTRSGRSKRQQCDPLEFVGRFLARAHSPFTSPSVILDEGCTRYANGTTDADPSEFSEMENRNYTAFLGFLGNNQKLFEEITEAPHDRYKEIWSLLKTGQGKARIEDTRKLKISILKWIDWGTSPRPKRNTKADRGFNNPVILKLLAPVDLELTEENIAALRAGNAEIVEDDGTSRPTHGGDWMHLWYDGVYDSSNMMKGFLKNALLVKCYCAIFISPTSAEQEPGSSGKATKSGNAALYGMTEVTPSSIAYVCTQVYFALSSHEEYSRSNTELDIGGMYDGLMSFFESSTPAIADYVKELLAWWNRSVFPASNTRRGGRGTMARLEARLAAQALPAAVAS